MHLVGSSTTPSSFLGRPKGRRNFSDSAELYKGIHAVSPSTHKSIYSTPIGAGFPECAKKLEQSLEKGLLVHLRVIVPPST